MMSDCKSSLVSLLIVVLICCLTVAGIPLFSTATDTENLKALNDASKTKSQIVMEGRNLENQPNQNSTSGNLMIVAVQKRSSNELTVATEPQCIQHHEFAEILGSQYAGHDPRVRYFVNRNDDIRYYLCLPCQACPPGVQILLPCHRKRDTICSTNCIDPDQVYDAVRGICVYPEHPEEVRVTSTKTPTSTSIGQIFIADSENDRELDVRLHVTTAPSIHHKLLLSQVTLITVGVFSLNVAVFVGVALLIRRKKSKKRCLKTHLECVNNTLSPSCDTPITTRQNKTAASVRNSETSRLTFDVDESCQISGDGIQTMQGMDSASSNATQIPSHGAKESNLNIFLEPGYEQAAGTISFRPAGDVTSHSSVQVLSGIDPYSLVMIGHFGPNGGVLSCEDSDVILEIPPGAIPADHSNQLIIARVSLRPDAIGPKLTNPDSIWLTPLVEFESPGLKRFDKDVRIRLPHCARMHPGWTFHVDYTDPTADTKSHRHSNPTSPSPLSPDIESSTRSFISNDTGIKPESWFSVEQKCILNKSKTSCRKASRNTAEDVSFTVDDRYFNILTSHFSKYCCSGCHKEHPLHMEAVVYWKYTKVRGREQMDLNVYVLDSIKDCRLKVAENENSSTFHTGYYPVILNYKKTSKELSKMEICVREDSMGEDWKWRLDTYSGCLPSKRVIEIQSLIRCCSPLLPSRQTFSFCPKTPSSWEPLTYFQAMVCIKQQNWPESKVIPILVTVPLTTVTGVPLVTAEESNTADRVISNAHIEIVVNKLSVRNWRSLYRKLMGSDADIAIEHIQVLEPNDTREQIHAALVSWKRSKGRLATVQELVTALVAIGEAEVAEFLEGDYGRQDAPGIILQDVNSLSKETQL